LPDGNVSNYITDITTFPLLYGFNINYKIKLKMLKYTTTPQKQGERNDFSIYKLGDKSFVTNTNKSKVVSLKITQIKQIATKQCKCSYFDL